MTDDFKKYIRNYKSSPEGIKRQSKLSRRRNNLLLILVFGFIISFQVPQLFILWNLYLVCLLIYAFREWMG